jgi:cyanophycin synthetase
MRVLDSRRLTGPNLLLDGPGAVLDVALDGVDPTRAIAAWRAALLPLLAAVGWDDASIAARTHAAGLSLAFSAPAGTLYAATEVNEAAWRAAAQALGAPRDDDAASQEELVAALRTTIANERQPWFDALAAETRDRGVTLLMDDRRVSVGLGAGSRAWPVEETAEAIGRIPWNEIADVPTVLVTGTNGKTTTVRLLGAIAKAAGLTAGVTSTDHVTIGDEVVATGDYSGPNGARTVLRDRRVEVALLEVARGGILRRGLPVPRAAAALVTNVANDHLGEFGIFDLEALADVKLVVAKAIDSRGCVVLNADDPRLLARGRRLEAPVLWFTLDADHPVLAEHLERGGQACVLDGDRLVVRRSPDRREIIEVAAVPLTFGGAARHNVANVLAAIGVAIALGLPDAAIRAGLARFDGGARSNPGRANLWRLGGVTAIVDFAHNPHGLAALAQLAAAHPSKRRGLVLGQAGDRDDESIRDLARTAWSMRPDHVFIKEMDVYLRGRERGVIPALIESELLGGGAEARTLSHWASELDAVRAALAWAKEGDLLVLTTHAQRDEVAALLDQLAASTWAPGQPLPKAIAAT